MVMRLMPSTLSRADRAPNMFAQRSGTSSDRLALRSLRNDVDCTNGRASPVLMHVLLRAWPVAVPPSGARLLKSYSDNVWFCAIPPFCYSHRNDSARRCTVKSLKNDKRIVG